MAGQDFQVSIVGNVTGFDVAPITNMNNALKQVPPAAQQASTAGQGLNTSLAQVTTTSRATGTQFQATGALASGFGNNINTARGSAQQMVGTNSALGTSFSGVSSGGLNANNTLNQLGTGLNNTTTAAGGTERSSISLGQKIALMGGFITSSVGSVFGLIEGFTGLEAAQVAADRAQQRVNTSSLAAEKAQDNYNKMLDKFGPSARQTQEALANLQNKNEANRIAEERAGVTQSKLNEAYVSFGLEVVTVVGEMAQMGSTVSILVGKLGTHAAAAAISADASIAEGVAAGDAAAGLEIESLAAGNAAKSTEATGFAALGLGAKFALIAAPLIAAVALFVLIETNTFGIGDAFRSILPPIGTAIDTILNGLITLRNGFVAVANGLEGFKAQVTNIFIDVYNSLAGAFNDMILAARAFVQQLNNAVATVQNFFIDNLINPIIRAWNEFNLGMQTAWNDTVNKLADFFKPVVSTILSGIATLIKGMAALPLGLGDAFKKPAEDITKFEASLKSTGTTGGKTAADIQAGFKGITEIERNKVDTQKLNTEGLIPLINTYANVNAASHSYDGELIKVNSTTGQSIVASASFYSHQENLGKLLGSTVVPAFQGVVKQAQQWTGGLIATIVPTQKAGAETGKLTGELVKAQKSQKDFTQTLTESISKLDQETAGIQRAIAAHQFAAKAIAETGKALQDAAAKQQELTTKLTDGTAVQNRYNTAIIEGTNKFLELILKTQDEIVTQQQYNDLLVASGAGQRALSLGLETTTKNMELVTKAALGDSEAMKQLQDSVKGLFDEFLKLGDEVGNKLSDALDKGHKAFKKALKEMEKETGIKFDPDGKFNLSVDASIRSAEKIMKTGIGLIVDDIRGGWASGIKDANLPGEIDQLMTKISGTIKGSSPEVRASFQKVMDDLKKIAAEGVPTPASLLQLKKDLDAIDPSGNLAAQAIGKLNGPLGATGPAAGTAAAGVDQFTTSVQQAGTLASVWQITLQNITVAFNTGFKAAVGDAQGYLNTLGVTADTVFANIILATNAVAVALVTNFNGGINAAALALNNLVAVADTVFANIIIAVNATATALVTDFNGGVNAAATAMNNLVALVDTDLATIITGFNATAVAMVTDFNNATKAAATVMNSLTTNVNGNVAAWIKGFNAAATALVNDFNSGTKAAGTAMNSLATNIATNVGNMISNLGRVKSAMDGIGSAADTAKGKVQALINSINSIPSSKTVTINIIEHRTVIQNVITRGPIVPATAGSSTESSGSINTTTTTTLNAAAQSKTKIIRLEISEPTVVKIDGRELIKQINKKLLELDIGALV